MGGEGEMDGEGGGWSFVTDPSPRCEAGDDACGTSRVALVSA